VGSLAVLSLFGFPRSGSTVIGRVLGAYEGACFLGEVSNAWLAWSRERRCGCGARVQECPVWGRAMGSLDHDPAETLRLQASLRATASVTGLGQRRAYERYGQRLGELYRALADATGARVLVDSSKALPDARLIGRVPGVRACVVHLVRDPRAAVHSRSVTRRERLAQGRHPNPVAARLGSLVTAQDAGAWRATDHVGRRALRRARWGVEVGYEDWAANPRQRSEALASLIGCPVADGAGPFVGPATVALEPGHVVSGNRNRKASGATAIAVDERWRTAMGPVAQGLVLAIAGSRRARAAQGR